MKKTALVSLVFCVVFFFFIPDSVAAVAISPTWGPAGKLVTVTPGSGESFGNEKGRVYFSNGTRTDEAGIYYWSNNRVVFQVPLNAPTREFMVRRADGVEYRQSYLGKEFALFVTDNPGYPLVYNPDQGLGLCHAVAYPRDEVSWSYPLGAAVPWYMIEKDDGVYDWTILRGMVRQAEDAGRKVWLQVTTTEGAVPDWATGVSTVGSRCDSRQTKVEGHSGCEAAYSLDGLDHKKGTPIPWNPEYQRLLRRLVHEMAKEFDENSYVEAILTMAGGCYGEQSICEGSSAIPAWEAVGYTNAKFVEASEKIIDIYLEDEYRWPDGKITHGFVNTPVVLQLGMGLYVTGSLQVALPTTDYAVNKYGFRVWLKQNGWGNHTCGYYQLESAYDVGGDYNFIYHDYVGRTRVGYERGHWESSSPTGSANCNCGGPCQNDCGFQFGNFKRAINDRSSYGCVSPSDISKCTDATGRIYFAKYAGAQITISNQNLSLSTSGGRQFSFLGNWKNLGNFPLIGQKRVGIKDEGVSYKLTFYFLQQDEIKGRVSIEPSWPTTNWFGPDTFETNNSFIAPAGLPEGLYNIKFAIEDEGRNNLRFRLAEKGSLAEDSQGRYDLGSFNIGGFQCAPGDGDANGDGKINEDDITEWRREFLSSAPGSANFNCDEIIDEKDLAIIANNWKP